MTELICQDLGRMAYGPALEIQHQRVRQVQTAGNGSAFLLLVEHDPPVITTGRRPCAEHVLATREQLAREGIQVCATRRGGGVTYHGPGQVVGYPIFRLSLIGTSVRAYVHGLEDALIRTLDRFGLSARRAEGLTGVWVGDEKIAAIGVAVSRWVTYHGFALNVATHLAHFGLIVPCGLTRAAVTSMSKCLGRQVSVEEVKPVLINALEEVFGFEAATARVESGRQVPEHSRTTHHHVATDPRSDPLL
jgi:lipoate-protein ligase B